jgi:hypothetical protein
MFSRAICFFYPEALSISDMNGHWKTGLELFPGVWHIELLA